MQMIDLANDFNLEQMVTEPTRKNNILDLFFTTNATLVEKSIVIPGMSDHDGIAMLIINTSPKRNKQKPHKAYLYNKADMPGIKNELNRFSNEFCNKSHTISGNVSVEEMWSEFKSHLNTTMDKYIPSKIMSKQNKTPWISPTIKRMQRRKQRAYNKARKSGNSSDWDNFTSIRKDTHKVTKFSYRKYVRDVCLDSKKQFWSFIKNISKDSTGISALKDHGALVSDNKQKADILNNQFCSVFTQEDIHSTPNIAQNTTPPIENITIHTPGIEKLLKDLNQNKAAGVDGISPRILKEAAHELAPILSKIFQASLDTGELPLDWRNANISRFIKG
ncbi:uncharacterized protein [Amphiura filiformis]|uniref:uncharacterized protein n=1 Tax=Amphiura filiformis TaxID=82378 RepID=UPI003B224F7F